MIFPTHCAKLRQGQLRLRKDNPDEWVASVLSYVRYEFAGTSVRTHKVRQSAVIQPEDVKKIRALYGKSRKAWTMEELEKLIAPPPTVK